jgi:hypothetical protein
MRCKSNADLNIMNKYADGKRLNYMNMKMGAEVL